MLTLDPCRARTVAAANARALLTAVCVVLIATLIAACGVSDDKDSGPEPDSMAPILLFNGTGTSPGDTAALEKILSGEGLGYSTVHSRQLNGMTESQIRNHRLVIVPGGNFEQIGNHLNPATTANIRNAVQSGLNYLGICAGAFFAGNSPYNGLNLTAGVRFEFYAAEARGIRKTAVAITTADGNTLDHYWEDGPQLGGWGTIVGKYPDGTPAIVQGTSGNGWVILAGIHPEAPAGWRGGMNFGTPANVDNAYAVTLIRAALDRKMLPHY